MALSGVINGACSGSSGSKYDVWIEWKVNSQSATANNSNMTISLKLQRNDGYSNSAYALDAVNNVKINVGSGAIVNTYRAIDTRNNVVVTLGTWTGNIGHNADGTLSFVLSAIFTMDNSSLSGGSASATITVNAINRYPTAPTLCTAAQGGDSSYYSRGTVTVSWSGATGTITKYIVQRAATGQNDSTYGSWTTIGTIYSSSGSGSITDNSSSYLAGVKFKYRVIAYNDTLASAAKESNILSVLGGANINISGAWKNGTLWVNAGGTWHIAKCVWINVGGVWKRSL